MAITPKEILAKLSDKDDKALRRLEEQLDESLRDGFDGSHFTYSTDLLNGASKRVRDELMRRYRAAGWTVQYHSDQRDGDYLSFSVSQSGHGGDSNCNYWDR